MPLYDRVEILCQAVRDLGEEEAEKLIAQAKEQAAAKTDAAEARRREELARTKAEVESRANLAAKNLVDRAELEAKRQLAQTKEALLEEIFSRGQASLQKFRETPEYADWLQQSLVTVLEQLDGESFRVAAHPEEGQWLTPELLAEAGEKSERQLDLAPDEALPPGGFMVVREDGRVRYDQTFQGILARQREDLRAELARRLWGAPGSE